MHHGQKRFGVRTFNWCFVNTNFKADIPLDPDSERLKGAFREFCFTPNAKAFESLPPVLFLEIKYGKYNSSTNVFDTVGFYNLC